MTSGLMLEASKYMKIPPTEIARIVRSGPRRYKKYQIPKRSGGMRTIAQPARELKDLQYFLMGRLLSKLPVHDAATAYRTGINIRHNALVHSKSSIILKMDFVDFFGSIKASDFRKLCIDHSIILDDEDQFFCHNVLFWMEYRDGPLKLSIGAPSSPMLSNAIVYRLDEQLSEISQERKVAYSRYADDLTFSCDDRDILIGIRDLLPELLENLDYPELNINEQKTILVSKAHRRTVTGLVITNDGHVSLGRTYKRKLRATVHAFLIGKLDEETAEVLRGNLAYCKSVEPSYIDKLKHKYGDENIETIMKREFQKKYRNE